MGAQNGQIWMATDLIGIKPDVAHIRLGARSPGSCASLIVTLSISITLRPTEPSVPSTPDWRLAAVICSQT